MDKKNEIPVKALYFKDLTFPTNLGKVETSGHPVSKVTFTDIDNKVKLGFYKPVSDTHAYQELLAILSVCGSVLGRLLIGEAYVAEERLVFNEAGRIIASVSISLEKFIPFSNRSETTEKKENLKYTEPSVETLIEYNIALFLVLMEFLKNDDLHPGNISLFGLIDFDMIWYHLTHIIKGMRWSCGKLTELPERALDFTWENISNFPITGGENGTTGPTHHPSRKIPGNLFKPKGNKTYKNIQELAGRPEFKKQEFEARLRLLLAYDPELLRNRLKDYIGNIPLDYLNTEKLSKSKAEKLSIFNKTLFNTENNSKPAIDVILAFIQNEFDKYYCTNVLFPGCEKNIRGVSVPSFQYFLRSNPSVLQTIQMWMTEENERIKKTHINYSGDVESILYNSKVVQTRYWKILRDSHIFGYNSFLNQYEDLISEISVELNISKLLTIHKDSCLQLDDSLTESSQLIRKKNIELEESHIKISSNPVTLGFALLIHYVNDLYQICTEYTKIPQKKLDIHTSQEFCKNIMKLFYKNENVIVQHLKNTKFSDKFLYLQVQLQSLTVQFQMYESESYSSQLSSSPQTFTNIPLPSHTSTKVLETCTETLFYWAKNEIELTVLTSMLLFYLKKYYAPSFFNFMSTKEREIPVTEFLKKSEVRGTPGDIVLAKILEEGGRELNSLNTLIIKHLLDFMFKNLGKIKMDINLASVSNAIKNGSFGLTQYTDYICNAAKIRCMPKLKIETKSNSFIQSNNFFELKPVNNIVKPVNNTVQPVNHIIESNYNVMPKTNKTQNTLKLEVNSRPPLKKFQIFNIFMYTWVNMLNKNTFKEIVTNALEIYSPTPKNLVSSIGQWATTNKKRKKPILEYLKLDNLPNSCILAFIFSTGGINPDSLNTILFKSLCEKMFQASHINTKLKEQPGYHILVEILENKESENKALNSLKPYSKDWSNQQETSQTNVYSLHFSESN